MNDERSETSRKELEDFYKLVVEKLENTSGSDSIPGWEQYGRHVLIQIQNHETEIKELHETVNNIQIEQGKQKIKLALFGAIGGFCITIIPTIIRIIFILKEMS